MLSEQATYYRTALLLGLVRDDRVHAWAERVIELEPEPPPAFFEIVSVAPGDLSGLRHALWPLVIDPEPAVVLDALFAAVHSDLTNGRRGLADTLTVLRQMRSMLKLPVPVYAGLNAALVAHADNPQGAVISSWLRSFAPSHDAERW